MVTFTKNWELALFWKKVDQLGTQIFFALELNKSLKTVQFNNQLLARKTHFLLLMSPSSSWWNNFYTYVHSLGFILFMNRKIINQIYFFLMGILGLFFCLLDSTLAIITSWHTITTSYYSTLHYSYFFIFGLHTKEMDLQLRFIQPAFLSGVLIYDDEQGSFINCVASNYYEWYSLGEDRPQKTENYYYLNRIILQCHFSYPKTILGNSIIAKHSRYISK
jgi:hypothetical protein